jgi:dihydrofolate reductase
MKAIAAMSVNRVIGFEGQIPWHLPEDLKFFKRTTLGHVILMGRKTYESIGKPLPGRESWVVSRTAEEIPGVRVISDINNIVPPADGREIFLIGGGQLYEALLPRCEELYLTLVRREATGDAFFPPFEDDFELAEVIEENEEMEMRRYRRI